MKYAQHGITLEKQSTKGVNKNKNIFFCTGWGVGKFVSVTAGVGIGVVFTIVVGFKHSSPGTVFKKNNSKKIQKKLYKTAPNFK